MPPVVALSPAIKRTKTTSTLGRLITRPTIGMTKRTATECSTIRLATKLIVLIAFLSNTVTSQTTKQPTQNVLGPK